MHHRSHDHGVCIQGVGCLHPGGGGLHPGGGGLHPGGGGLHPGKGVCNQGLDSLPPPELGKRALCILLECFLVEKCVSVKEFLLFSC